MRILLFLLLFLIGAVPAAVNAQTCQKLTIVGPAGLTRPGETIIFALDPSRPDTEGLKFVWTVNAGIIEKGQGEEVLFVRTQPESAVSSITAVLEVTGLPEGCQKTFAETVGIARGGTPPLIDEWGRIALNDERGRLDIVAAEWRANPKSVIVVILYRSQTESEANVKARSLRIKKHLIALRKFPADRLIIVQGNSGISGVFRSQSTVIYRVPEADKETFVTSFSIEN